jgi:hypothetical protein
VNVLPGACPVPPTSVVRAGNACNPYQDGVIDCCVANGETICPAPVSMMTMPAQ